MLILSSRKIIQKQIPAICSPRIYIYIYILRERENPLPSDNFNQYEKCYPEKMHLYPIFR